jgi:large subunit ribosomal protein L31
MKTKIHPKYYQVEVECDCGNKFKVGSTRKNKIKVEVCSACHPLYTGRQKLIDTTGRVKRFESLIKKSKALKKKK